MKLLIRLILCLLLVLIFFSTRTAALTPDGESIERDLEEPVSEETMTEGELSPPPVIEYPNTPEGWKAYLKGEVVPVLATVISVVASVYVAISPALYKIKRRSEDFQRATADVNRATGAVAVNREELSRAERELAETTRQMKEELGAYREELSQVKRILRMGFSNQDELVIKGVAKRIAKVGTEREEKEEPTNEGT